MGRGGKEESDVREVDGGVSRLAGGQEEGEVEGEEEWEETFTRGAEHGGSERWGPISLYNCMLTYADVCRRMPTYADVCCRRGRDYSSLTHRSVMTYADVC